MTFFVYHPFLYVGNVQSFLFFFFCKQLNLDRLLSRMWDEMGLVRVYTKPQGQQPDFTDPVVLSAVCCIIIMLIMNQYQCFLFYLTILKTFGS